MKRLTLPPNGKSGEAVISETTVTQAEVLHSMFNTASSGFPCTVVEGVYKRLHVEGILQMSNTRMEQLTNSRFVREARGRILIAGLGIGYVLTQILPKPEVVHVTVVEKSADVVRLVAPHFACPKLSVFVGDITKWRPSTQRYEVIYFDIWPSINPDNLKEMGRLHRAFRKYLAPGGYMDSWSKEYLPAMRRRGY